VHLFTFIQLGNLILLWVIKSHPTTSIAFPVMLVVICAIRKFMECIFTKRELRLLDDLLPESDKNLRKGGRQAMIKQLSKKIAGGGKHHWSDADDDIAVVAANKNEAAILREKKAKAALRERALDLGLEVEHLSFKEVADKKRSNLLEASSTTTASRRRSSDATFIYPSGMHRSMSRTRSQQPQQQQYQYPQPKIRCTIYVKHPDHDAYVSLCLRKKTLKHFLDVLKTKFDKLMGDGVNIANVYQRNKKGLKFLLDDDLLEHLENHQIFDIDLQERLEEPEKFDMTITEVQA